MNTVLGIRCTATGIIAGILLTTFATNASADAAGPMRCQEGFCATPTIDLLPAGSSISGPLFVRELQAQLAALTAR